MLARRMLPPTLFFARHGRQCTWPNWQATHRGGFASHPRMIKEGSSIVQAETAEKNEDDIGDDASSAIPSEKVIGYVGRLILGRPPSKSQSQPHCGSQAELTGCWRNQAGPRSAHDFGESRPLSHRPVKGYARVHQAWLPCRPSLPAIPCHLCT